MKKIITALTLLAFISPAVADVYIDGDGNVKFNKADSYTVIDGDGNAKLQNDNVKIVKKKSSSSSSSKKKSKSKKKKKKKNK